MIERLCIECTQMLPVTEFHVKRVREATYYQSYCKPCNRKLSREREARIARGEPHPPKRPRRDQRESSVQFHSTIPLWRETEPDPVGVMGFSVARVNDLRDEQFDVRMAA